MCEATSLAKDMADTSVAVQVIELVVFEGDRIKKNIRGRATLSDGVTKVICMIPERAYTELVSVVLTGR